MTVDPQLEELAQRTPNFGFLLAHEAVLVRYGAAAESMVFTDPNTSMVKARQFGEQLVAALVTEIVDDLQAALNEFAAVAEALEAAKAARQEEMT